MSVTPRLTLPFLAAAQAQKHVTVNEALSRLDGLVHLTLVARDQTAPPESADDGMAWAVPAGATGAWAGHAGTVALWSGGGWLFLTPAEGWRAHVAAEARPFLYRDGDWVAEERLISRLDGLEAVGIGTAADPTHPLAVRANAAFLAAVPAAEGGTGDLRLALVKEAAGDTASLLFQTGWSGRAEIGLAGSDNLQVKVSADGSSWTGALTVERTSGHVGLRGATSPVAPLHVGDASSGTVSSLLYTSDVLVVSAQGTAPGLNLISAGAAAANRGVFKATRARGSLAAPAAVQSGDQTFSLIGAALDGTAQRATAGISFVVDGTVTDNVQAPQAIIFETGTASRAERLRITPAGHVGIGTASPAERLTVAGQIAPAADNAYSIGTASLRASVVYAATGTINTSDLREKCDLADSELGLAFIRRLRPRSYRWRVGAVEEQRAPVPGTEATGNGPDGSGPDGAPAGADPGGAMPPATLIPVARPGRRRHHGLIAQEVRAALDDLGIADFAGFVLADPADPDSRQGLRYDQFIAPLVKAVQELDERLQRVEAEFGI
jgi:hypothetical protein